MALTNINVRVESDVKSEAQNVLTSLGLDMTTAINIFLRQTIRQRGIPFAVTDAPEKRPSVPGITLASEKSLAREWMLPEEDEAWADL